mmetsp:Transcript_21051/g.66124  ORF Transcript_21051/g.66124 Transcript_21051/m.66124 type:complete len:219 (-) Transcript_21051:80-736(-)
MDRAAKAIDQAAKRVGLRRKTRRDKIREAGAKLGLDKRASVLTLLWVSAALPWFGTRVGPVTPIGLASLAVGHVMPQRLEGALSSVNSAVEFLASSFEKMGPFSKMLKVGNTLRSAVGVAAFGNFAAPLAICLVLYYSATLAFTLRPSIAPVEALGLRLSYKILSLSLIAASAGTIVILALAKTPPALGALLGVAAALWAYECSEQLDRQHAKKHKDD